jgi:Fic family protein
MHSRPEKKLFGDVADGKMSLNEMGTIVQNEIIMTKKMRANIKIDEYIIMPNHAHIVIHIRDHRSCTLQRAPSGSPPDFVDQGTLLKLKCSPVLPNVGVAGRQEVSNYVAALNHGLQLLEKALPLSLRLIKEIHGVLLSKGRGSKQTPGEFRRSQNWIGGTRPGNAIFVPPPADDLMECLSKFELFLHDKPEPTSVLLKAALAHVQFETIHPFLDGNGRLGRLLITLLLCEQKVLHEPMLYLSLYFKTHRRYYYKLLNNVRLSGEWEAWLDFFAEAVIVTATQAIETAQHLLDLSNKDREKISELGRAAASTLRVHRTFMEHPIATSGWLVEKTGITPATVNKVLNHLVELGIVRELTAKKRNRLFSYAKYIDILNQGTELP